MKVSILGASGYVGGELLRLLLDHPEVSVEQVTSERLAGKLVTAAHPNLRGRTTLRFSRLGDLAPCDLLFAALPHGSFAKTFAGVRAIAPRIVDMSADFRLRSPHAYRCWYGHEHANPAALSKFVYGIPELHRTAIASATCVTGAGCLATTAILGLLPLFRADVVANREVFIEAKVGSSAAGNKESPSSHHPERSGTVRSFQPTGHRHTGEIVQELAVHGMPTVHFSATAIELVRGILVTAHVRLAEDLDTKAIWNLYRAAYRDEPFIRIVKETRGVFRYPEPKILAGSNYCDVGFERDPHGDRLVVLAALDNLMKGAAGNGIQAMNVMAGWDERTGLGFPGLHPV
ncbi:MAG: N-acetyl-gamma-glutamyl-phosphate reductase [Vicinamibacterales bacterium]|jgi:N-acetyl-gamma-glutamyl-phosphate/LysW-gamma-L-alpha-aminoadipyl-6-phosphate reductase|nr:N-acetyl-gamma-glutamyl-phosphate reductase [Acidobacteriota bacterium]MDP6373392.1 N-acetyl-gamma-glutamyl-phosphate reductase [Vicinamibacterales bacterium]MDP6610188.1 N-acetyl-gamma-glutamyl-phosphate reductase [Vicinamibacterales bacterium]HAK56596.1 N-acetyl-gamma-glutamyl-phosphate reductase [Acidobacteriota bacterium]|tara:strand:+ start:5070 stop:6107 length:1038 start_codon:yes stop_codon:yes gene_type:complete